MSTKPIKKNQQPELLQEQIIKLEKQLESFKHSNDHFLKNKLFLHYDVKEPEKVVVDCETKLPILAEIDKKKIQKGKESEPTHLIIEGDNYHALSVLNYTHVGKIDLIYIDPPYNTGHKDFIYNDRFVDREDSFRHSKWLSFMTHRLRLAKNLLAETGVIFISIDDNEQAHLRLLCDQIFGEENFVACAPRKTGAGSAATRSLSELRKLNDFVLIYKNINTTFQRKKVGEKEYDLEDEHGKFMLGQFQASGSDATRKARPNMWYPIYLLKNGKLTTKKPKSYETEFLPSQVNGEDGRWLWNKEKFERDNEQFIYFDGEKISRKIYFDENKDQTIYQVEKAWIDEGKYQNARGTTELAEILGRKGIFNNPKPVALLEHLINLHPDKSATILDFFAGSGTTGHAVLKLNIQDGGNRQFILCSTNGEKEPIVDKVLYPRIKKVIDGYGDNVPIPANLRYFKTDFVEKKGSASQLKIDLTRQCADMLCVKENVFEEIKLKKAAKNYKFFKNGNKYLAVFFDFFTDPEFSDFIKELNALPKEAEKTVYIFVLDGSAGIFADEFADVANCEVKEIPQKILDIYKQLAREVARK